MKKIISAIMVICTTLSCIVFSSQAEYLHSVTFYYLNNVEVTVELNDELTYEQIKRIADHIAGIELEAPGDQTMLNPQCAAGNHSLIHTTATYIHHNVYTTSPKCEQLEYDTWSCNRIGCDYYYEELIQSKRISSCHG